MDYETHVGFVDTHAECNGGNDDINLFHKEFVLVFGSGLRIESGMIWQCFYAVDYQ